MTFSALAGLVILVTLPISYAFVKLISLAYKARDIDNQELKRYSQHKQRYLSYFE